MRSNANQIEIKKKKKLKKEERRKKKKKINPDEKITLFKLNFI